MPQQLSPNEFNLAHLATAFARWPIPVVLLLLAALALIVWPRPTAERSRIVSSLPLPSAASPHGSTPIRTQNVAAAWYDVPTNSLAKRRAAPDEFTAAHERLPLGTLVRVTHMKNHKSVLVRITDRGIHNRRIELDLCKEAAGQLDMLGEGVARVQMEVLPDTSLATTTGKILAP